MEALSLKALLYIFIGGGSGSLLRYLIGWWTAQFLGRPTPWATCGINLLGSLLIGLLLGLIMRPTGLSADYHPLLIIGFCGGFTTFSTLSADLVNYLRSGELLTALAYLSLSLIGGVLLAYLGLRWGRTLS